MWWPQERLLNHFCHQRFLWQFGEAHGPFSEYFLMYLCFSWSRIYMQWNVDLRFSIQPPLIHIYQDLGLPHHPRKLSCALSQSTSRQAAASQVISTIQLSLLYNVGCFKIKLKNTIIKNCRGNICVSLLMI